MSERRVFRNNSTVSCQTKRHGNLSIEPSTSQSQFNSMSVTQDDQHCPPSQPPARPSPQLPSEKSRISQQLTRVYMLAEYRHLPPRHVQNTYQKPYL